MASLLYGMPKVQSSSSFQDELRESLMEKSQSAGRGVEKKSKAAGLFTEVFKYPQKYLSYPLLTAATVIMAIALTVFYNQGPVKPGPGNGILQDPYTAMIEQNEPDAQAAGENPPPSVVEKESPDKLSEQGQEADFQETGTGGTSVTPPGKDASPSQGQPAKEPESGPEEDPGKSVPLESQGETTEPETEFKVGGNLQSFKVAGKINLPPVFYKTTQTEAASPVEKVNHSWKPRKTVASMMPSMMQSEARSIATPEWAKEILSNEGFPVREGDSLESRLQETSEGTFVEVSYSPQKSGVPELPLILHYGEGKGILAYYYQEDGKVLPPGFYSLLSPAQAFEQVQGIEWYASSPRLDFSFQEVYLTYHDFPVEDNAQQKTLRLPSYCFLGRETFNNGGELKLYLPAVQ